MKKAFSLVEIIIVVTILGILAAVVLPVFKNNVSKAKEASTKDTLRVMRGIIELYAVQHDDVPPGYENNDITKPCGWTAFWAQIVRNGKYIQDLPQNPFNKLKVLNVIANSDELPAEATGQYGWIYKPATKDFRIDWPGNDTEGVRYYDY